MIRALSKLNIGDFCTKKALSLIIQEPGLRIIREGLYYCKNSESTLLFCDLVKINKPKDFHYNDFFQGKHFHWDSQSRQHIKTPRIQEIVNGSRDVYLFCRMTSKIKGRTQPFVYCGALEYVYHDRRTENPVHVVFKALEYDYNASLKDLKDIYEWLPDRFKNARLKSGNYKFHDCNSLNSFMKFDTGPHDYSSPAQESYFELPEVYGSIFDKHPDISVRTKNILSDHNIHSLEELHVFTENEILSWKGAGVKVLAEIKSLLAANGKKDLANSTAKKYPDISVRTKNILSEHNIHSLEELHVFTENEILSWKGAGVKVLAEIKSLLAANGKKDFLTTDEEIDWKPSSIGASQVYETIKALGGKSDLKSIYTQYEEMLIGAGDTVPKKIKNVVRGRIYEHSREMAGYIEGKRDMFVRTKTDSKVLWSTQSRHQALAKIEAAPFVFSFIFSAEIAKHLNYIVNIFERIEQIKGGRTNLDDIENRLVIKEAENQYGTTYILYEGNKMLKGIKYAKALKGIRKVIKSREADWWRFDSRIYNSDIPIIHKTIKSKRSTKKPQKELSFKSLEDLPASGLLTALMTARANDQILTNRDDYLNALKKNDFKTPLYFIRRVENKLKRQISIGELRRIRFKGNQRRATLTGSLVIPGKKTVSGKLCSEKIMPATLSVLKGFFYLSGLLLDAKNIKDAYGISYQLSAEDTLQKIIQNISTYPMIEKKYGIGSGEQLTLEETGRLQKKKITRERVRQKIEKEIRDIRGFLTATKDVIENIQLLSPKRFNEIVCQIEKENKVFLNKKGLIALLEKIFTIKMAASPKSSPETAFWKNVVDDYIKTYKDNHSKASLRPIHRDIHTCLFPLDKSILGIMRKKKNSSSRYDAKLDIHLDCYAKIEKKKVLGRDALMELLLLHAGGPVQKSDVAKVLGGKRGGWTAANKFAYIYDSEGSWSHFIYSDCLSNLPGLESEVLEKLNQRPSGSMLLRTFAANHETYTSNDYYELRGAMQKITENYKRPFKFDDRSKRGLLQLKSSSEVWNGFKETQYLSSIMEGEFDIDGLSRFCGYSKEEGIFGQYASRLAKGGDIWKTGEPPRRPYLYWSKDYALKQSGVKDALKYLDGLPEGKTTAMLDIESELKCLSFLNNNRILSMSLVNYYKTSFSPEVIGRNGFWSKNESLLPEVSIRQLLLDCVRSKNIESTFNAFSEKHQISRGAFPYLVRRCWTKNALRDIECLELKSKIEAILRNLDHWK